MLKFILILLIYFSSFINIVSSSSCPDTIDIAPAFSSKTCTYRYTIINSTCTFVQCRTKSSSKSLSQLMGWTQCFSQCCEDVSNQISLSDNNIDLLYECQSANNSKKIKFIAILVSCLLTFLITIVVGFICYAKSSCPLNRWLGNTPERHYTNNKNKISMGAQNPVIQMIAQNLTSAELADDHKDITLTQFYTNSMKQSIKTRSSSAWKNMQIMQAKCLICLGSKPNCQLNCNHNLHSKCLGMWFERNYNVSPCGDVNLKVVRVHCIYCLKLTGVRSIHSFKKMFGAGKNSFKCQRCKQLKPTFLFSAIENN